MSLLLIASVAASFCGPHDLIVTSIQKTYGEYRIAAAVSSRASLVETFVSKKTGTYTILQTSPDGLTCVVSFGSGWVVYDGEKPKDES